jgi:hypothetical protein
MATNIQGTRTSTRPSDRATGVETEDTTVVRSTGIGGVEVFDSNVEETTNPSLRRSASLVDEREPIRDETSGSPLNWILSAIVAIVLIYFLLQWIF